MTSTRKRIKNSLLTYRKKNGLSQKSAACLMGLKKSSNIARYEHGAKLPGLINALKLEIIYHIPISFLYEGPYRELKHEIQSKKRNFIKQCKKSINKRSPLKPRQLIQGQDRWESQFSMVPSSRTEELRLSMEEI